MFHVPNTGLNQTYRNFYTKQKKQRAGGVRLSYFRAWNQAFSCMKTKKGFASDNNSGVHPAIMQAMAEANTGHCPAYGNDDFTAKATERFRQIFGTDTEVFLTYNGTGANIISLRTLTDSFHSILCSRNAHINEDECSAPERFTGCKLIPLDHVHGKISVEAVAEHLVWLDDEHRAQPRLVSITQSTEYGTVYTRDEIEALAGFCHANGMFLHMDGARISNAAARLGLDFRSFTRDAGVDILSFGGTKNGMMFGEAVLIFHPELAARTKYYRKQAAQLHSKMRFIAAQFIAFLETDVWQKNAQQANNMATLLYNEVKDIPGVQVIHPVEANGVFAIIPAEITAALQEKYRFYIFDEHTNMARWMCSFDTTEEEIRDFSGLLKSLL